MKKTAEEILKGHKNYELGMSDEDCIEAMEEHSSQTRDEMFEFAHWLFCDEYGWQKNGTYYRIDNQDKKMSIKELFDYWKTIKP